VAVQAARLIAVLAFAVAAVSTAVAQPSADRLKTPKTPWTALAPNERRVLGPVQDEWDRMPGYQQQRLLSSARRYPSLQPIQKERFDARIRDWAAMTPEQRRAARETFQGLRRLPPDKQHELRERWLQRHRQAEELSEPHFGPEPRQREFNRAQRQRPEAPPPRSR
jgi:Protein of unknown function (DUF3106)